MLSHSDQVVSKGLAGVAQAFSITTALILITSWRYEWLMHPLTDSLRYTTIYLHVILVNLPRGAVTN